MAPTVWTGNWDRYHCDRLNRIINRYTMICIFFQMVKPIYFYTQGFLTFISPPPQPYPKHLTLLSPLQYELWIFVIVFLFVGWMMLYSVAVAEDKIMKGEQQMGPGIQNCFLKGFVFLFWAGVFDVKPTTWNQSGRCLWTTLATFLGESMHATVAVGPRALRYNNMNQQIS